MKSDGLLHGLLDVTDGPREIDRIRTLILQLAFQGRLGNTHREFWRQTTIGDIAAEVVPGFACSKTNEEANGHVHLRTHNVGKNGRLNFDLFVKVTPSKINREKASIRAGDVIFNNTNSQELVGKTCLVDRDYPYAFSNHLTVLRFTDDVAPAFVVRYFNLLLRNGVFSRLCNRWIGQAGINSKALRQIQIDLPSIDEQKAVVARVDAMLAFCDDLERGQRRRREVRIRLNDAALTQLVTASDPNEFSAAWQRIRDNFDVLYAVPENVAKLRQGILQLAVQGKLGGAETIQDEYSGNDGVAGCFPTPKHWQWVTVKDVADHRLGKMLDRHKNKGRPCPYLRNTNVHWFRFDLTSLKTLRFQDAECEEYALKPGDVLICEGGHGIGRTAVWTDEESPVKFQKALHRVRPTAALNSHYFAFCMRAYHDGGILERFFTGSGIPHLTGRSLGKIVFPLPPRAEQDQIVQLVLNYSRLCDDLEAKLKQQHAHADRLAQAVVSAVVNGTTPNKNVG